MGFNAKATRIKAVNLNKVVDDVTDRTVLKLGLDHTSRAKALAPVDEGQLRNSLSTVDSSRRTQNLNRNSGEKAEPLDASGLKKGEIYSGSSSDHAIFPEYGTRYMVAQPYIRPAAEMTFTGANGADVMKKYNSKAMASELKMRKQNA